MARTMLWLGAGITLAFVLIALLAPVISPYDFDAFEANGKRFPQLEAPSRDHLMGTNVQSHGCPVESHLGYADGAQGRPGLALHLHRSRRAARALLRLLRGQARPRARADHGRAPRVPVPAARDRRSRSFSSTRSASGSYRRHRDHGRLHPSVLPCGPDHAICVREEPYVEAARALGAKPMTIIRKYVFFNVVQNVPADRDAQRGRRHPDARGARLPRLRHPAHRRCRMGLRRQPRGLGPASGIWWTRLFPGLAIVLLVVGLTLRRGGPERRAQPGPAHE